MSQLPRAPWRVVSEFGIKRFDEHTGQPVTPVTYHWVKDVEGHTISLFCGGLDAEIEAEKARLFAAAPEILAALRDFVSYLGDGQTPGESALVANARTALAKVSRVGGGT